MRTAKLKALKLTILILTLLTSASYSLADVVKYTDENNTTFFVDSIDKVPVKYRDKVKDLSSKKISKVSAATYEPIEATSYPVRSASSRSDGVEVLVASWCSYCSALEKYLVDNKVRYKKYDIEKDAKGRTKYNQLGRGGVPITQIGSTVIRGYNTEEIDAALKKQRL